jgi:macrolide-specific efflux system membrane fusion protein
MQVSGQLKKLLVDVGAVAEAGRLHAEIDPSVYQEAKVDGDRAQLVLAELQFTRQENVAREDATTTDALQSAGAAR